MSITITKRPLSPNVAASGYHTPIAVTATAGVTPIVLHLGITGTATHDEVYIYAQNNFSAAVELSIEFGVSATNALKVVSLEPRAGETLVIPGTPYGAMSNAVSAINAFVGGPGGSGSVVASSGLVTITGWVNRVVQT